jgi:hypothetical protein
LPYQPDPAYDFDYEYDPLILYEPTPTQTTPTIDESSTTPTIDESSTTPTIDELPITPTIDESSTTPITPTIDESSTTPTTTTSRASHLTFLRIHESNPETINVSYPTTKPYGYGSIKGWYGSKQSSYLLNHPIKADYEQMNQNYVTNNQQWKFLHLPRKEELPEYGSWWNWDVELQKINNVIDYLGETLGKFETHFISATEIVDKLRWVPKINFGEEERFEIENVTLKNALTSKISAATKSNAVISFTQQEWDSFNITTNIITLHYIKIGNSQYKPFSPGTDRVNNEALAIINRDWEIGAWPGSTTPNLRLRVEECGGVCLSYKTKNNRQRFYIAIDTGMGSYEHLKTPDFINKSNDYKKQWLRKQIYSGISHEYTHVFQSQIINPRLPTRWYGDETLLGERSPNAISRWWIESFASILQYFIGFSDDGFDIKGQIVLSISNIRNNDPTTSQEFADRMIYSKPYGYLTRHYWSFLAAAYMAKLTSWKYVLVDFYYDFQRVPSNTLATAIDDINDIYYVPDLDKLFLHNFGKTEENFLKDLYTLIKTDTTIDINYFLPNEGANLITTANVLPAGSSRYVIEGFRNSNETNSNKVCNFM